ncbi:MAG TPA: hypothetical protein VG389_24185 [Myxococcota bacterium]|nr:hypothetical protein [Myxococcota bacterium]
MRSIPAALASTLAIVLLTWASPVRAADTRAAAVGVAGDAGKPTTSGDTVSDEADATPSKKWKVSVSGNTSYVGGLVNSGTDLANPPAGATVVGFGPTYNPSLDFTVGLGASYKFTKYVSGSASYRLSKGFAFDDSGEYQPGNGGSTSTQLVDTGDLGLRVSHGHLLEWEAAKITLSGSLSGTIPASRNSLFCNPLYGAIGAGLSASHPFEVGISIGVSTGVSKPFYAYTSPPRGGVGGACTSPLADYDGTTTLSGTVYPTSDRDRYVGRLNSSWAFSNGISIGGWHTLLALAFPKLKDGRIWKKFSTSLSAGISSRMVLSDPSYTVQTATGPVVVDRSRNPLVHSYTYAIGAGYALRDDLSLGLSFSNAVPQLLYDPSTYYATWLPSTTVSLSVSGSF